MKQRYLPSWSLHALISLLGCICDSVCPKWSHYLYPLILSTLKPVPSIYRPSLLWYCHSLRNLGVTPDPSLINPHRLTILGPESLSKLSACVYFYCPAPLSSFLIWLTNWYLCLQSCSCLSFSVQQLEDDNVQIRTGCFLPRPVPWPCQKSKFLTLSSCPQLWGDEQRGWDLGSNPSWLAWPQANFFLLSTPNYKMGMIIVPTS